MLAYKQQLIPMTFLFMSLAPAIAVSSDLTNTINIESVSTARAYPIITEAHTEGDQLVLKGKLKRKKHDRQRIRGHVDIQVLDKNRKIIDQRTVKTKQHPGTATHDHFRTFKTSLDMPQTKEFKLKIYHHIGTKGHS